MQTDLLQLIIAVITLLLAIVAGAWSAQRYMHGVELRLKDAIGGVSDRLARLEGGLNPPPNVRHQQSADQTG